MWPGHLIQHTNLAKQFYEINKFSLILSMPLLSNLNFFLDLALVDKLRLYIKPIIDVILSILYSLTKSLIYILKLIICSNYLQINFFQIIVVNTRWNYFKTYY